MFNEILTGKASLENKPAPTSPYREESVPVVSLACADCRATFTTKVNSGATKCPSCHMAVVQANAAASARAVAAADRHQRSADTRSKVLRIGFTIAIVIGLALFKTGMRNSYREDMRTASGVPAYSSYSPGGYSDYSDYSASSEYDPFVARISSFAYRMCACADTSCANVTQGQFEKWLSSLDATPTDNAVLDAAAAHTTRYSECMTRLQQQ